jgi:DNA primase catalytic core
MARIPDEEIERLKKEISIERLVTGFGVELKGTGANLVGRCPFHEDHTPSLIVTPENNLWACKGKCNIGGSVIDWVMQTRGVSFRNAVELLRADHPSLAARPSGGAGHVVRKGTALKLASPVTLDADDQQILRQVVGYYHQALKDSPEALRYLQGRGLTHPEMLAHFQLGFANRTLGYTLEDKNRKAGAEARGRLQRLGILRESGHEHMNGSVVIPIFDLEGAVLGMYGRKITPGLREGTPLHMYLPGPHRGVWNEPALQASKEIILCESLIDALTFWCAGFRNVTASYGVNGFTDDHRAAFRKHGVERVWLAYDRDEAGETAAQSLAEELLGMGIACFRVLFPKGMDANEYALKVTPASESLEVVLNKAEWLGKGKAPERATVEVDEPAAAGVPVEVNGEEIAITLGDRRYRVRGLSKNPSYSLLRVNLLAARGDGFHVDTLDLYSARQRAVFLKQAAIEMGVKEDAVKHDLRDVLRKLEEIQDQQLHKTLEPKQSAIAMSEQDRAAALELLKDPRLLDRILADFERCGVVGEETNKLAGYIAAVSRSLEAPLAVMVQSSSAAGKSSLMDAILAFVPEEHRIEYSAMTGQSLFYMGEQDLKHKVLAIVEEEGASRAAYALKLLQSEGALTMASTGKDAATGRLVTHQYRVEGPVMIFLTTTAIDLDEELLNRCLVLTVNEGREQTQAIHRLQREQQTLEGLLARQEREEILKVHRNAQRLLQPLLVANPYARELTFLDSQTRTRRDHTKYLTLIRSIALLHQHQRPVKTAADHRGKPVSYIEVTVSDIEIANRLAHEVLGRSLDELPPQTRRLLLLIDEAVTRECQRLGMERADFRFSRRDVRVWTEWGDTVLKKHLGRLEDLEYLLAHRGGRGQSFVYELMFVRGENPSKPRLPGLIDMYDLKKSHREAEKSPSSRPQVAGMSRGGRPCETRMNTAANGVFAPECENSIDTGGR